MDVKFITTTADKLDTVPVVDGQIVALYDTDMWYYDMNSTRRVVTGNLVMTALPDTGIEDALYIVNSSSASTKGVYIWSGSAFVKIADTQDINVTSTADSSSTKVYLVGSTSSSTATGTLRKNSGVYLNCSEKSITAVYFHGKADEASSADSAAQAEADANGLNIASNYVKSVTASKSGSTVTFTVTYGDATTKTFTVTDSNTTYSAFTGATSSAAGSAGLVPAPSTSNVDQFLKGDGTWATPTDTKNTAGSTSSTSKLFIVGAASQAANPQTYSRNTAYIGTDGHLYSNSLQVVNLSGSQALTNKTYNGYTLGAACAKSITNEITDGGAALPTAAAVYDAIQDLASEVSAEAQIVVQTSTPTYSSNGYPAKWITIDSTVTV